MIIHGIMLPPIHRSFRLSFNSKMIATLPPASITRLSQRFSKRLKSNSNYREPLLSAVAASRDNGVIILSYPYVEISLPLCIQGKYLSTELTGQRTQAFDRQGQTTLLREFARMVYQSASPQPDLHWELLRLSIFKHLIQKTRVFVSLLRFASRKLTTMWFQSQYILISKLLESSNIRMETFWKRRQCLPFLKIKRLPQAHKKPSQLVHKLLPKQPCDEVSPSLEIKFPVISRRIYKSKATSMRCFQTKSFEEQIQNVPQNSRFHHHGNTCYNALEDLLQ